MNVLVINAGSSSLKYQLLDVDTREVYAKGNCERIGIEGSFVGHEELGGEKQKLEVALPDHKTAIKHVFDILKTIDKPIDGIGHRVVQGGWYFPESAVVDDKVLAQVREVAPLAPLHNYAEADVIEICRELFPEVGNVIVCDTSFHFNMPEKAHRYALPRDVVDKYHVRKYGAHGTSHRYIWRATNEFTRLTSWLAATLVLVLLYPLLRMVAILRPPWALLHLMALSWALAAALLTQLPFSISLALAATPSMRLTL